jgi:hypothetical protein
VHIHLPKPLHGWREFVGEIGVIAIGILIALGAEQAAEVVHHNRQRAELLEAMHDSFEIDARSLAQREQVLLAFENYITDLSEAVTTRMEGKQAAIPNGRPPSQTPTPIHVTRRLHHRRISVRTRRPRPMVASLYSI